MNRDQNYLVLSKLIAAFLIPHNPGRSCILLLHLANRFLPDRPAWFWLYLSDRLLAYRSHGLLSYRFLPYRWTNRFLAYRRLFYRTLLDGLNWFLPCRTIRLLLDRANGFLFRWPHCSFFNWFDRAWIGRPYCSLFIWSNRSFFCWSNGSLFIRAYGSFLNRPGILIGTDWPDACTWFYWPRTGCCSDRCTWLIERRQLILSRRCLRIILFESLSSSIG